MSLPSSEPLPDNINDLPPARQRHIRRLPGSATPAERQILLDSLVEQTSPTLNFFLFTLIGALLVGSALYFNDSTLLIVATLTLPFLCPIFSLGLLPTTLKAGSGFKALISLLIPTALMLVSGAVAGWLQKEGTLSHPGLFRFSSPYWLDLSLIAASTILAALVLLRQGRLPRLIGALLSYEILIPLALAGFGFVLGIPQLCRGALLTGLLHLAVAVCSAAFSFILLGFFPKKVWGWLLTLVPLALTLAFLALGLNLFPKNMIAAMESSPTPTAAILTSQSPVTKTKISHTPTAVPVTSTPTLMPSPSPTTTASPTQTPSLTSTPTPEPTSYWGKIDSLIGAVVRETPDFEAVVITYANDGNLIEILDEIISEGGTRWFKIRTDTDEIGWLLSSLVVTPTPTMTP
jgi:hypothetical protein